ncbi:YvrJ family protein [Tuberibacillus sp. Marseille-P3662]|uniref:YvrJ family protein n=1 Tax=Tuberibacillus sp. Marseille-P3662 TaxID=1965358 RepID=UPI000A1CC638|nr:YvrJ family protein [Tuberibacillus sp. Marseille-P3662]
MEQWLSLISDVGFPAVVTLYLLHRIERKLDTLNQSIVMLPERMKEQPLAVSDETSIANLRKG